RTATIAEATVGVAVGPGALGRTVVAVAVVFAVVVARRRVRQAIGVDLGQLRPRIWIDAMRRAVLADSQGGRGAEGEDRQGRREDEVADHGHVGLSIDGPPDCGVGETLGAAD